MITSVEWLIEVDRNLLPKITETIKGLNGGYLKTIEETKDGTIIALSRNPSEIALPDNVKRTPILENHSAYEKWDEVGGKNDWNNYMENHIPHTGGEGRF